jgi:16S rRNA (cytosine1402-N4)-methyltransferase
MEGTVHEPVMVAEVLSYLCAAKGGTFLDCTAGGGGHSEAILNAHPENKVFAIDRDSRAVERATKRLAPFGERAVVQHAAFSELSELFVNMPFTGVLADLGISSDQLSEERGFSFNDKHSLDMRMNEEAGLSAQEIVNQYTERQLIKVFKRGGVGKGVVAISKAIVNDRPFETATELATCIHKTIGERTRDGSKDSATVPFQALRMEVNDELGEIDTLMNFASSQLEDGSRLVVLCFHSLEDKAVVRAMRKWASGDEYSALWKGPAPKQRPMGRVLTKKAVVPTQEEVARNARSRSTRLRAFQFERQ